MKKIIFLILATISLTGCDTPADVERRENDWSQALRQTPGLEDCQYHEVSAAGHSMSLLVIRCPHSDTTTNYQQGKVRQNIFVPD